MFYVVRCRTNCKAIRSIGVETDDYYAYHKNHTGKQIYTVVTAFVLNDNDIEKGGTAIPICCARVGKMMNATRDSYLKIYKDDGSYHYPKIQYNLLREKGTYYFKGIELTVSNIGAEKDPKVSLLDVTKSTTISSIEEQVVTRYDDGRWVKVCVVY